ncbi:MAG: hypothetical protein ACYC0B_02100 [Gemmatimonadaceae bacterium]
MVDESVTSDLSFQKLRTATELLARQVVSSGCATEEACAARAPGAPGFEEESAEGWLRYFGWLHQQMGTARAEVATATAARPLSQVLHEALADTSVPITLRSGEQLSVHAKSLDTLIWLEALDAELELVRSQMADALANAIDHEVPEPTLAQQRMLERLLTGLALRLFVWTLTTEGPGLPFSENERDPEPPAWTRTLHSEDVETLFRAHLQVNHDDLDFLASAFPSDAKPGSTRLPLSGFMGAMAHEWGLPARQVMRQWTLRSLYASAITAGQASREAHAAANTDRGGR